MDSKVELLKSSESKLESLEKVNFEISPEKLLEPIDKEIKDERFPRVEGIDPCSWFLERSRCSIYASWPILSEIDPYSWVSERSSCLKF